MEAKAAAAAAAAVVVGEFTKRALDTITACPRKTVDKQSAAHPKSVQVAQTGDDSNSSSCSNPSPQQPLLSAVLPSQPGPVGGTETASLVSATPTRSGPCGKPGPADTLDPPRPITRLNTSIGTDSNGLADGADVDNVVAPSSPTPPPRPRPPPPALPRDETAPLATAVMAEVDDVKDTTISATQSGLFVSSESTELWKSSTCNDDDEDECRTQAMSSISGKMIPWFVSRVHPFLPSNNVFSG